MPRVAAVAIDAAEWSFVEDLARSGRLPTIARMLDTGTLCRLEADVPYRSETVWVQFLTGRSNAANRWYGPVGWDRDTYDVWVEGTRRTRPFFAGTGCKTIAFDLIHASLSDDVLGPQVLAWGNHSPNHPRASDPEGLLTEIDSAVGTNPAFGNEFEIGWHSPTYIENLTEACLVGTRRRTAAIDHLLRRDPDAEFLLTNISEVHSGGHHFWFGIDPAHGLHGRVPTSDLARDRMVDLFVAADREVGALRDRLGPDTTIVVFALHGMQPSDDLLSLVLLPELVHRRFTGRGLLRDPDRDAWRRAGCPPVSLAPDEHWTGAIRASFRGSWRDGVRRAGRLLPHGVYNLARRAAGLETVHPLGDLVATTPPETPHAEIDLRSRHGVEYQPSYWYRHAWPTEPWFVLPTFADTHIRVNLAGREARGIVDQAGFAAACGEIERFLGGLQDAATGEAILGAVHRTTDDPMDPAAPDADLVVEWERLPEALHHPAVGTVGPFPHARTASHSNRGFALFEGPGIERDDIGTRPMRDLTPTLLALLGIDAGTDLDGRAVLPAP